MMPKLRYSFVMTGRNPVMHLLQRSKCCRRAAIAASRRGHPPPNRYL
jgi:hypothetical protein